MVIQNLKSVLEKTNNPNNRIYVRNLLKEELQVYVLNFIYTSEYKNLIFTGGTALRRFYNLPRLSEDLDFDIEGDSFDFEKFQDDIGNYFKKNLQYQDLEVKLKNNTIFLRFPVLKEIGFSAMNDTNILFLRIDFAYAKGKRSNTELRLFSAYDFSFLARLYDFPTLFDNKVSAFLSRDYKKGGNQQESFKGRDAFDVVWMIEEAKKTGIKLLINTALRDAILKKAEKISSNDLYNDLIPFFADINFVKGFCNNYYSLVKTALSANKIIPK
jgi:predicted nucleotidyltransferase component of viral defense system